MKNKHQNRTSFVAILCAVTFALSSCNDNSSEIEKLREDVKNIEQKLEECANGPDKLLNSAKSAFEVKDYKKVVTINEAAKSKHPGSSQSAEIALLAQKASLQIAEQDKLRIEGEKVKQQKENETRLAQEKQAELEKKEIEAKTQKILSGLKKEKDEMRDIFFYTHKSAPKYINSRSIIEPYITLSSSGAATLRLKNIYVADDWLFIESYKIKADDNTYDINTSYGTVETDNGAGDIWEWMDETVSTEREAMLRAIAASKKTTIRYNGKQYYKDRVVSDSEKKMISDVLIAFDYLKANPQ